MDYQEEVRHQRFDKEKAQREALKAHKRWVIISILAIILAGLLVLSGCGSLRTIDEMYDLYDATCTKEFRETKECVTLDKKILDREDRIREKRYIEEHLKSLARHCNANEAVMVCHGDIQFKLDLIRCGCLSRNQISNLY